MTRSRERVKFSEKDLLILNEGWQSLENHQSSKNTDRDSDTDQEISWSGSSGRKKLAGKLESPKNAMFTQPNHSIESDDLPQQPIESLQEPSDRKSRTNRAASAARAVRAVRDAPEPWSWKRIWAWSWNWKSALVGALAAALIALVLIQPQRQYTEELQVELKSLGAKITELESFIGTLYHPVDIAQRSLGSRIVPSRTSSPYLGAYGYLYRFLQATGLDKMDYIGADQLLRAGLPPLTEKGDPADCWPISENATAEIELGRIAKLSKFALVTWLPVDFTIEAVDNNTVVELASGFSTVPQHYKKQDIAWVPVHSDLQSKYISRLRITIQSKVPNCCYLFNAITTGGPQQFAVV